MHAAHNFVTTYVALPSYFVLLYLLLTHTAHLGPYSISTQVSIGLIVGYVFAAISESWQHRFWGHSATRLRDILWRVPGFGQYTWKAYWLHNVIHHARTHRKNATTLFKSAEEKEALHASLTEAQNDFVIFRRYGLTIPWSGFGAFLWLPMITMPWVYRYAGEWAMWASVPPMFMSALITKYVPRLLYREEICACHRNPRYCFNTLCRLICVLLLVGVQPCLCILFSELLRRLSVLSLVVFLKELYCAVSQWCTADAPHSPRVRFIHPLMHRPYEAALQECSGLTHYFMRTSYARWVIRHHWLHHQYPRYNFNFMMGGDLLMGVHRFPSEADLKRMAAEGIALH